MSLDIKPDKCHLINTINIGNPINKFEADTPPFRNIPDFWNSKSAILDFIWFGRCPFNVFRKKEK